MNIFGPMGPRIASILAWVIVAIVVSAIVWGFVVASLTAMRWAGWI